MTNLALNLENICILISIHTSYELDVQIPGSALIWVPRYHRPQRFKVKSLDSANPRTDGYFTLTQVASLQANWGAVRPAPRAQTLRGPIHLPREITGLGTYCAEKIKEKSPGLMFQS